LGLLVSSDKEQAKEKARFISFLMCHNADLTIMLGRFFFEPIISSPAVQYATDTTKQQNVSEGSTVLL